MHNSYLYWKLKEKGVFVFLPAMVPVAQSPASSPSSRICKYFKSVLCQCGDDLINKSESSQENDALTGVFVAGITLWLKIVRCETKDGKGCKSRQKVQTSTIFTSELRSSGSWQNCGAQLDTIAVSLFMNSVSDGKCQITDPVRRWALSMHFYLLNTTKSETPINWHINIFSLQQLSQLMNSPAQH